MLKVGVTGGIGSGKTVVCEVFKTLGIPVFNADDAARYLMDNDSTLVQSIQWLLGDDIYVNGKLDREKVSTIVFSDPVKLKQLNNLVHPAVIGYTNAWMEKQQAPYLIREAAIFYESGTYKDIDVMIGIYAPRELRIERAMKRNKVSREQVLAIMAQQMDEDEKMKRCNYIITNDDASPILPQVLKIHELLLNGNHSPAS